MANCVCCNCELPATSIMDQLCPECIVAMETGLDRAPVRSAEPVPAGFPALRPPVYVTSDPDPIQPVPTLPVRFPVTRALVFINAGIFALCLFLPPSVMQKHAEWGMNWGPATLGGEWWRMFTSMFLHVGWGHILGNMGTLWVVGKMIEPIFPRWTFLFLYFLTGLAGKILSLSVHPELFSCGASGAIFGIAGVLIAALCLGRLPPDALRFSSRVWSLVFFTALSLFVGDTDSGINYLAHLGDSSQGSFWALFCVDVWIRLRRNE